MHSKEIHKTLLFKVFNISLNKVEHSSFTRTFILNLPMVYSSESEDSANS